MAALSPGTRLGPYEVAALIGAGGMGEVYQATDTNLKRAVALKVLPASVASDAERLARFQREAEVLASLNHPNIAAIHGLERSGGITALVMELVEGPTLAELIAGGSEDPPLPLSDALAIARQIAEALEAAHEQGIIHRDLKPANVKVRPDGTVKVLDFGLAKALAPAAAAMSNLSMSPTITTPAMTQAGMILGTAAYMSPEQAKGRDADKRSDVWAFGCVLYEMLSGRRAFDGEDMTDVLGAVVRLEPDWTALPPNVPPLVRTLLQSCLVKDRRRRVGDISTARFVLDETSVVTVDSGPGQAALGPAEAGHYVRRRVVLVAAAIVAGAALTGLATRYAMRPAVPRIVRTTIAAEGDTLLALNGLDRDVAITPDGSRIVYRGNGRLFVRVLDQLEPTTLTEQGGPRGPFASPDGQWVGFFDGNTPLKKIAITGGPAVTVSGVDGSGPRGATWGDDGTIIFATNGTVTGLQRVSSAGGEVTVLTRPNREQGEGDHLFPEFLPGAAAVLFTISPAVGNMDAAQVAVLDLRTMTQTVLVRGGSHARYVPGGHLVYGVGGTLRAVAFDLDRLAVTGTPVPILEGVVMTPTGAVDLDIARDGTMVYVPGSGVTGATRALVWLDRTGREEPISAPLRAYTYPRISPDGRRVALDVRDQEQDIWIWDFARRTLERLTFGPATDQYPVWTRDSRRVLFASAREGQVNVFWQAADNTGAVERLTNGPNQQLPHSVAHDGSRLVFREDTATKTGQDLMIVPLPALGARSTSAFRAAAGANVQPPTSQASPGAEASAQAAASSGGASDSRPLVKTTFNELNGEISPDGRWIAYQSNESGRDEIYVRPFPDVETGRWQVSSGGGVWPLWDRTGRELFYVAGRALMSVRVEGETSLRSTTGVKVLDYDASLMPVSQPGRTYDVSPDGKRFLMVKQSGLAQGIAPQNLVLVQHWLEDLKRLLPR